MRNVLNKNNSRTCAGLLVLVMLLISLIGCGIGRGENGTPKTGSDGVFHAPGAKQTIRIISGSENKELEPIIAEFVAKEKINVEMDYKGSLDIMRKMGEETFEYDAVWPAGGIWISAGDSNHRVKHQKSISVTPVVFGIRESLAEQLGFTEGDVSVSDILEAIRQKKMTFCMTSATQSNSGASAYIGFLYALLGGPDQITEEMLQNPELRKNISELLSGVDRSSGSSDWLKDMFLKGNFDAMVNYEALIISANRELEAAGKETLHVVYPYDGLSLADSPLAYYAPATPDEAKEKAFLTLQNYLLSEEAQNKIQQTGRRNAYGQVTAGNETVFRKEWGCDLDLVLSPINMPSRDILFESLSLYQTEFRKPSLTIYCLDFSGSMSGSGQRQLMEALEQVLDQEQAKKNLLQANPNEKNMFLLFNDSVFERYESSGKADDLKQVLNRIHGHEPYDGTDIYGTAIEALRELDALNLEDYNPAIILMSDGRSNGRDDYRDFENVYVEGSYDVPVFAIMFGDAREEEMVEITALTNGRVFDGREDLIGAFRKVKGYN